MKKLMMVVLCVAAWLGAKAQDSQQDRLHHHVFYLASDSLRGRKAGSEDAHTVVEYIVGQYQEMGIRPMLSDYRIPFSAADIKDMLAATRAISGDVEAHYNNVMVMIPGNHPQYSHEFILIGAHFDHLGVMKGMIYNGADDNASGTAAVLEVARNLKSRQSELHRSVIICNFDAEEIGLLGSKAMSQLMCQLVSTDSMHNTFSRLGHELVVDPNMYFRSIDNCRLMMSVDMVGYLKSNKTLIMEGASTLEYGKQYLTKAARRCGIPVDVKPFETSVLTTTDTDPFARAGVPTLAISTGLFAHYHSPSDDAEQIDYQGLDKIVDYLTQLTIDVSRTPSLQPTGELANKHRSAYKPLEVGLELSLGRQWLDFPNRQYRTHKGWGFNGGLSLNWNFYQRGVSLFSINAAALHDAYFIHMPTVGQVADNDFFQQAFLFPAQIRCGLFYMGMTTHVGVGMFHCHPYFSEFTRDYMGPPFSGKNNGLLWEWGLRMNHWDFSWMYLYPLGDYNVRNRASRVSLTYLF